MKTKLQIVDMEGETINITDLDTAIMQARNFSGYSTRDPNHKAFMANRGRYWKDVLEKLLQLKQKQHGNAET
ncbi:hypothetical protein [Chitinophaga arvensicola]|uniref:Uncharacterized protein n=1 Tax=Chitinophaga arvensicola TaxID=29529 RepID=A0A1I0PQ21_9BACT|nr:hypothetical protein [Chitinophaga arvensicola]SEW16504.1 hypothetical protein SAMN04488122_0909 [Chitinophaga arvensicola]